VGHTVFCLEQLEFAPTSSGDPKRQVARLSDALTHSRANVWRMQPGARGSLHIEHAQEEMFVVLEGDATLAVGEPPELVSLPAHSIAVVEIGTPLQLRNESEAEAIVLILGAPPITGQAEHLPDPG
jgi:mannose-6-phosphate isomerase-like protein (cupin superfamily)